MGKVIVSLEQWLKSSIPDYPLIEPELNVSFEEILTMEPDPEYYMEVPN